MSKKSVVQRVARLEVWPVNVPLVAPYLFALGTYRGMSRTIIRVTTNDGVVGVGETSSADDARLAVAYGEQIMADPVAVLKAALAGGSLLNATHHGQRDAGRARVRAAVEMALWDIAGRTEGKPVAELIGRRVREHLDVTEYFAFRLPGQASSGEATAREVGDYCAAMVAEFGAVAFEGKVATMPVPQELRMLRAVREAIGPDRELRIDANLGWSLETAHSLVPELVELGVTNIEEPVGNVAEMALLRQTCPIPFSGHEPDFVNHRRYDGIPDTFVLSVAGCGGIANTVATIERCRQAGIGFWFYSGELGPATAATLQVAAATEHLTGPSQSLLRWYTGDVIEGGPFVPRDGRVSIPATPGLGVELDMESIAAGVDRYDREGEYAMYDALALPRY